MKLALPFCLILLAGCLSSPPPETGPADLSATPQTPGTSHAELAQLAGEWSVTVTAPGSASPVGVGEARIQALHGQRFLRLEVELTVDGRPLTLTGHVGRVDSSGQWQALWLSNLSTGMSLLRGRGRLSRGVEFVGEADGVRGKSVLRVLSEDSFQYQTYGVAEDGGFRLLRTSEYVRK